MAELVDEGVSAFKGRHAAVGALGRFVADVEAGGHPDGVVLLTEKLDRLSREPAKKVFAWMLRMTEMGVVIATVDGDRRYDSDGLDMGAIIEVVVKAQLANEESEKKASRLAAAWTVKRGRLVRGDLAVLTRRAPGWLAVEGDPAAFVVIPERAAIVRRIFEATVAGVGKHSIARALNEEGVGTFGRASAWHASYVQKLLASLAVLGEFQPATKPRGGKREAIGDPIPNYYPAIVDAGLHARAMRAMRHRSRRSSGRGRRLVNLLSGLARCGACGSKMTFRGKGLKRRADGQMVHEDYLICDAYQRGLGCRVGMHFAYPVTETAVLDAVLAEAMEDRHFVQADEVLGLEREAAERVRRRDAAVSRRDTALSLYLETQRTEVKASWSAAAVVVDELDAGLAALSERIVAARGAVPPDEHLRRIAALRASLDADDEAVRFSARALVQEALHDLIAAMAFHVDPKGIDMELIDGRKVHAFWDEDVAMWDLAVDGDKGVDRSARRDAVAIGSARRASASPPSEAVRRSGSDSNPPRPSLRLVSG